MISHTYICLYISRRNFIATTVTIHSQGCKNNFLMELGECIVKPECFIVKIIKLGNNKLTVDHYMRLVDESGGCFILC